MLYALLSGLIVWMAGPLLMTLFQVDAIDMIPEAAQVSQSALEAGVDTTALSSGTDADAVRNLAGGVGHLRDILKDSVNDLVQMESRKETLIRFCWVIMLIVLAKNLFLYLQGFFMAFVQQSVIRSFRDRLFKKYQRLSLDYFHSRRTGQVISRVTNDVIVLNESIDVGFNRLVTDSIMAFVFTAFLVIISWKLTVLAMVILPVVFGFIWFIGKKLRKYSERSQERMADVNSVLEEAINNVRIVKAFSMEKFETAKFMRATYDYFRALLRMTRIRHLASPINDTLATVAGVIILLFAGTRIIDGSGGLDAGDFLTFVIAMFSMIKPVKSLSQIHIKIQEGMAAAERIFEVIDAQEKVVDPPSPVVLDDFSDRISFENISFSYDSGEQVLKGVTLEVKAGEVVAFVGPSGGGKSTLLDLLPRFYDPQQGSIRLDGHDIKTVSLSSLRGLMGIVTQETILFNDTIRNNIAYGLNGVPSERVLEAARMANAHEFIQELAGGYETEVGNRGVKLSGGQRQRIAIARALLKNPRILIFDEATSALDTESELLVQQAINRLMENRTSLVIAHRLSTIKNADRILVIDHGEIVESGNHEQLIAGNGLYKRLYDLQFKEV